MCKLIRLGHCHSSLIRVYSPPVLYVHPSEANSRLKERFERQKQIKLRVPEMLSHTENEVMTATPPHKFPLRSKVNHYFQFQKLSNKMYFALKLLVNLSLSISFEVRIKHYSTDNLRLRCSTHEQDKRAHAEDDQGQLAE